MRVGEFAFQLMARAGMLSYAKGRTPIAWAPPPRARARYASARSRTHALLLVRVAASTRFAIVCFLGFQTKLTCSSFESPKTMLHVADVALAARTPHLRAPASRFFKPGQRGASVWCAMRLHSPRCQGRSIFESFGLGSTSVCRPFPC